MADTVKVGDKFPVSELVTSDGQRLELGAGPAVVYFYPADGTETCTLEAHQFNRAVDDYAAAGVALVGVSVDDDESHRCFAADEGLRFPLVSDAGGELTGRVGLIKDFGEYGMLARRATFLLDGEGIVRRTWDLEDPDIESGSHPADVLAAARELGAS